MISFEFYFLEILKKAQKSIDNLSEPQHSKIISKIDSLTTKKSKLLNIKKLQGHDDLYRLKVDDYRIVFLAIHDKKSLLIVMVGHRKEAYNKLSRII
jgi:mRNA interferase RelE/StbE